ncbi:hypothetical protein [Streptodolium elevatio]|uniref:Ribbon-helix-helix protein CopG domain-containing protein n=1 Tax=Streptodolium elevatio TaxID=3157996 RepID=A0ABV3DMD7_9ACTN
MANAHKHKQRVVRGIDDDLIADFDQACRSLGSDRSAEVRRFMEWFVRRPDAQPPRRPDAE